MYWNDCEDEELDEDIVKVKLSEVVNLTPDPVEVALPTITVEGKYPDNIIKTVQEQKGGTVDGGVYTAQASLVDLSGGELIPANIVKGKTVLGVEGTAEGSGKDRFEDIINGVPIDYIADTYNGAQYALSGIRYGTLSIKDQPSMIDLRNIEADRVDIGGVIYYNGRNFESCTCGDINIKLHSQNDPNIPFVTITGLLWGDLLRTYQNCHVDNYKIDLNAEGDLFSLDCYDDVTFDNQPLFMSTYIHKKATIQNADTIYITYIIETGGIHTIDFLPNVEILKSWQEKDYPQLVKAASIDNIIFRGSKVTKLLRPIEEEESNSIGAIYVPENLVNAYKADPNWKPMANKIHSILELPEEP